MKKEKKNNVKKPISKTPLFEKIFPPVPQPKNPSCYQMLVMENRLKSISLPNALHTYTDKQLIDLFHIKLDLVEDKEMPNTAQTILKPVMDCKYNAILTVRKKDAYMVNALIFDVSAFLINMSEDGKIKEQIIRAKKEKVTSYTLKRDCLARMIIMPREEIEEAITLYDKAKPKPDEIRFVFELSKKYRTTTAMVTKRIRDVRRFRTSASYADCRMALNRLDFLEETKQMKEICATNKVAKPNKK